MLNLNVTTTNRLRCRAVVRSLCPRAVSSRADWSSQRLYKLNMQVCYNIISHCLWRMRSERRWSPLMHVGDMPISVKYSHAFSMHSTVESTIACGSISTHLRKMTAILTNIYMAEYWLTRRCLHVLYSSYGTYPACSEMSFICTWWYVISWKSVAEKTCDHDRNASKNVHNRFPLSMSECTRYTVPGIVCCSSPGRWHQSTSYSSFFRRFDVRLLFCCCYYFCSPFLFKVDFSLIRTEYSFACFCFVFCFYISPSYFEELLNSIYKMHNKSVK